MEHLYRRHHFMDDTVFRSSPSSLYAYSFDRRDLRSPRMFSPYELENNLRSDYFGLAVDRSYSPYQAFSPYVDDRMSGYSNTDFIRRSNREAALENASISRPTRYALIHPLRCHDGRYPSDFTSPRPLEDFLEMGEGQLERIMMAYELTSRNNRSLEDDVFSTRYGYGHNKPRRLSSLIMLFESLGAYRLAEQLRWRRPAAGSSFGLQRPGMPFFGHSIG